MKINVGRGGGITRTAHIEAGRREDGQTGGSTQGLTERGRQAEGVAGEGVAYLI